MLPSQRTSEIHTVQNSSNGRVLKCRILCLCYIFSFHHFKKTYLVSTHSCTTGTATPAPPDYNRATATTSCCWKGGQEAWSEKGGDKKRALEKEGAAFLQLIWAAHTQTEAGGCWGDAESAHSHLPRGGWNERLWPEDHPAGGRHKNTSTQKSNKHGVLIESVCLLPCRACNVMPPLCARST